MTSLKHKTLNYEDLKQITLSLSNYDKELEKAGELLKEVRIQIHKIFWDLFELRVQMIKKVKPIK